MKRPRITVGVAAAAAIILIGAACTPAPAPAPEPEPEPALLANPAGNACAGSTGTGTEAGSGSEAAAPALAPEQAAVEAVQSYVDEAEMPAEAVRIVTVEETPDGPNIETHVVDSAFEAAAVAVDEAQGGDLVAVEVDERATAVASNDPYRSAQWGLDVSPFEASWAQSNGTGVIVAVIDTGVNHLHTELSGQVYQGWTFLHPNNLQLSEIGAPDGNGHGTHVSGTVAAHAGNGVGVTGAAPGAKILPVRVLDANGSGWYSDITQGITWAASHGARVINMSLGGPSSSFALDAAITYAHDCGVVVVAAAGNSGNCAGDPNGDSYPAASPGVIGVAAIDSSLARACFSNVGSYVDIAAPGVGIWSTTSNGSYGSWSGTSMATPHVAAAAAIVIGSHPACDATGADARILNSTTDLGPAGLDQYYGSGLVDPLQAAQMAGC